MDLQEQCGASVMGGATCLPSLLAFAGDRWRWWWWKSLFLRLLVFLLLRPPGLLVLLVTC